MADPLQELSDRAAIVRLTHDYAWALDERDWDALREVFTADVVADLGEGGQQGIDEVIPPVSTALGPFDASHHVVSTHQITIDGDRAQGRCYLIAQHVRRTAVGGPNFTVGGRYEDQYVRTADGWRISTRRIVVTWTDGNPAAGLSG
jgi:3-phenylpropionate/cinnamic acid dioxygenase small subunit